MRILKAMATLRVHADLLNDDELGLLASKLDALAQESGFRDLQNHVLHNVERLSVDALRSEQSLLASYIVASHHGHNVAVQPPMWGERLLYLFLPKDQREYMPGDLAEEFRTLILPKYGTRYVRVWYWKQVFSSLWPILSRRIIKCAGLVWGR